MSKPDQPTTARTTVKYSIDLPAALMAEIEADAAANGRKRSDHIRFLIAQGVHLRSMRAPAAPAAPATAVAPQGTAPATGDATTEG